MSYCTWLCTLRARVDLATVIHQRQLEAIRSEKYDGSSEIDRLFPSERGLLTTVITPGSGLYLPYVDRTDLIPRYLRNGVKNIKGE